MDEKLALILKTRYETKVAIALLATSLFVYISFSMLLYGFFAWSVCILGLAGLIFLSSVDRPAKLDEVEARLRLKEIKKDLAENYHPLPKVETVFSSVVREVVICGIYFGNIEDELVEVAGRKAYRSRCSELDFPEFSTLCFHDVFVLWEGDTETVYVSNSSATLAAVASDQDYSV